MPDRERTAMESNKTTGIDVREYMNLRKVLADKDYYLKQAEEDGTTVYDLMLLLRHAAVGLPSDPEEFWAEHEYGKQSVTLLNLIQQREKARINLIDHIMNDVEIMEETIDVLKVYADICFYSEHEYLLNKLLHAAAGEESSIPFGPIQMPCEGMVPKTYELTYRMLFFSDVHSGRDAADQLYYHRTPSPKEMDNYWKQFESGTPSSASLAYLIFLTYKEIFIRQQHNMDDWDPFHSEKEKLWEYYTGIHFDGNFDMDEPTAEPLLARDMSKHSYYKATDKEVFNRNIVRRAFFDAIVETGYLPAEVTAENDRQYSLGECLEIMGIETFFNTADAAFYMHRFAVDNIRFQTLRELFDKQAEKG